MKDCFRTSRRGLSTVVTGAIMLSAVAIMGTTLVAWSNSNLFAHLRTLDSSYSDSTNKINEFLIVENVWVKQNGKALNITLNNLGTVGLNVTKIALVENNAKSIVIPTKGPMVPHGTYNTQIPYEWTRGSPVTIFITTARGSIFTTQVTP